METVLHTAPPRRQRPLGRIRHVHMVGIGGIGMSSIAEVLLRRGYHVSGSDLSQSEITEGLAALGAVIHEGHAAAHVGTADVVVHSSAVDVATNPETQEALRKRVPVLRRAEMLGELMRMKYGVGIAGTHGKTTTTTMTGLVVNAGGFDPTIIVGGKVSVFGSNAVSGEGDIIVIEADEYDRTFLRLTPSIAVITNIEAEHMDTYEDLDDLKAAFIQYANGVPFFGAAILCLDDLIVQEIRTALDRPVITYGTTRQADIRAENVQHEGIHMVFDVLHKNNPLGTVRLQAPGIHNVRNALAAVAVGLELEMPFAEIAEGLAQFTGVQRRFEVYGEAKDICVIDDYAHHPTEVQVTLKAAHLAYPNRRLVAVFQPHLYTRTQDFQEDFARSFFNADVLIVTDIYPARETPIPGITGENVAHFAKTFGHREVHYVADKKSVPAFLQDLTTSGDVVITMGAGDIWRYGKAFYEQLIHA